MKRMSLMPFCIFTFLTSACVSNASQGNDNPAFAPEVNPHPKYFMTVKGDISPEISKETKTQFQINYAAFNPSCVYAVDSFEGIYRPYTKTLVVEPKIHANGHYSDMIPIDYYLPGKCNWRAQNAQFIVPKTGYGKLFFALFTTPYDLPPGFQTLSIVKMVCDSTLNCNWQPIYQFSDKLPINQNYTYELDLIGK